ncbi:arginine--tRNA ligase [Nannocystis radixulma]|uniref:Arginine--tRNA ligase n=1 Tax=Nannocystis radixulma TaxID=2995305 RepID=A0ABT5B9D4_9BACT|nr:arginine--tRNA ligase [Nannocystis radixulma]MDC0670707.1 arginine--tRNA ligase [Nannocystis radixulma]
MHPGSLAAAVARALHPVLPAAAGLTEDEVAASLTAPPDPALGDFAFPCFKLAKALRKGPPQIAAEIAAGLAEPAGLFARAVATGPYVNLTLRLGDAAALVLPRLGRGEPLRRASTGVRVMVEFSQPNTHKAFHVGHMRNLCLGDSLVRLLRGAGDDVVAANYLGDVGAHIAKCLWWYLDRLHDRTPPPDRRGEWLGELYAAASNQLEAWEDQAQGGDVAAASALQQAKARTSEILHRLEAREPEIMAVWQETREWSLEEFAEIYKWCDVGFDRVFFESEVDEPGLKLVEEFLEKGVFVVSNGAVGVVNDEVKHMPFFMLRKQDGTSLYSTKDLALARLKFEEYRIDRSVYVVDVRQSDHFRHVFLTLKKMGFYQAERCQHVPYEMVELPDGPMAGRKGNVVLFRSLRQQMTSHLRKTWFQQFEGNWPAEEIDAAERTIALGAIKYGMLNRDVNQKIVFDLAAWLNLDGNTGPYLQYTGARAGSILRECGEVGKTLDPAVLASEAAAQEVGSHLQEPQERELVLALDRLPQALQTAAEQLRPSIVCTYAFELCRTFNRFYNADNCRVKPSEGPLLQARLLLVHAFVHALREALDVLGIAVPRRM